MILQNFVLNLSRNLETQLPAHVGKALGRSGQLSSFNLSDPGTRTPLKPKIQQAAEAKKEEEKRGKEKEEEKKRKERKNEILVAVSTEKQPKTSNQLKISTQLDSTREGLSVSKN